MFCLLSEGNMKIRKQHHRTWLPTYPYFQILSLTALKTTTTTTFYNIDQSWSETENTKSLNLTHAQDDLR